MFNKFITFIQSFVLCVKPHSQVGDSNNLTLPHERGQLPTVPSMFQVSIQGRGLSYPFGRVTTVLGPLHGDARSSYSISVADEGVPPKINVQASTPVSKPQSYEVAISSMKRGGVEFYHGQSFPTSITGVINTSTARVLTLTPSHP